MSKGVHVCDGCVFFASGMCNYLLVMDIRRGCPAGAGCDKKMTKKEFCSMGIPKAWDKEAGRQMWLAGKGDAEIAKACGVAQGTISYFRKKHWEVDGNTECRRQNAKCDASDGSACGDTGAVGEAFRLPGTGNPSPTVFDGSVADLAVPPPEQHDAVEGKHTKQEQEGERMPENETLQSNDGVSREEYNQVVQWMVDAQRRADEAEAKLRKLEKAIGRMAVAMYGGD